MLNTGYFVFHITSSFQEVTAENLEGVGKGILKRSVIKNIFRKLKYNLRIEISHRLTKNILWAADLKRNLYN